MVEQLRVAVIGPGDHDATREVLVDAEAVGRHVGRRCRLVITGGRGGVMAAASRGAQEVGAITVGILPGLERGDANAWLTVPITTGLGEARNVVIVSSADAVIAVGTNAGTESEVALARALGRPVCSYSSGSANLHPAVTHITDLAELSAWLNALQPGASA